MASHPYLSLGWGRRGNHHCQAHQGGRAWSRRLLLGLEQLPTPIAWVGGLMPFNFVPTENQKDMVSPLWAGSSKAWLWFCQYLRLSVPLALERREGQLLGFPSNPGVQGWVIPGFPGPPPHTHTLWARPAIDPSGQEGSPR